MVRHRSERGFLAGFAIGSLGGMIGLGGAEFRLPLLVRVFRLRSLEAVILNKATSLIVVSTALLTRSINIPVHSLWSHIDVAFNLLAGSLIGAWWAAGHAMTMPLQRLDDLSLLVLLCLGILMLGEALYGIVPSAKPLVANSLVRIAFGIAAGLLIGMVAATLGVAGGELLIPTIVLLYGVDIKLAGSLSLVVSLPTMLVGFLRYRSSEAFAVLYQESALFKALTAGSILGAIAGGLMLGLLPSNLLTAGLGLLLLFSAWKTFRHTHSAENQAC